MRSDTEAGATCKETTVNGNHVHLWKFSDGDELNSEVRRVAAALPRDMDGLDRIDGSPVGVADVYFEPCADGEEIQSFEPPEGYEIIKMSWFETDTVSARLGRVDDE